MIRIINEDSHNKNDKIDLDLAEYIFQNSYDVIDSNKFKKSKISINDVCDYEDVLEYFDSEVTKDEYNKAAECLVELYNSTFPDIYHDRYQVYFLLSSNPTLYDINVEVDDYEYSETVQQLADDFESETGTELHFLGRGGKRVCVDFTFENLQNYDYLCKKQQEYEKYLIDYFNNKENEE